MEPLDHPEKFLSTPSARRATWHTAPRGLPCKFLSTPSARRATRNYVAPRLTELFLSTPSARRATFFDCQQDEVIRISIHALREEGDRAADTYRRQYHDFYPRPPRGGRPLADEQIAAINEFLSTPSARRATFVCHLLILLCIFLSTPSARRATRQQHLHRDDRAISIHALREEGDAGEKVVGVGLFGISIHALREEGDPNLA